MRKKVFIMTILFVSFACMARAYDDHDFQVWNTDSGEIKLNNKTKLVYEQEFRWGNNASQFFYQHYDLGLFYDVTKWLNVGAGYRHILDLYKDHFKPDYDPYLTATLSGELKGFKFDDRSRMEYNDFDYKIDFWRYRNKFTVKFPWKFTKMEIQPVISEEAFLVFGRPSTQFNQNRFAAGLAFTPMKNMKGEIYYMLQSFKSSGSWKDANVLGAKIKLSF